MKRLALAVLAAAILPAAAAQAGPTYYFTCPDQNKAQQQTPAAWSPTAPTASYQSGAGCGMLDVGLFDSSTTSDALMDFTGGGTYTGAIDTLTLELHSLLLSQARAPVATPGMVAEITVDGKLITDPTAVIRVTPEKSSTGLTEAYRVTFVREPLVDEDTGEETPVPLVAGTGPHTVNIRFTSNFLDYSEVWVWGASEIPSHVEFNAAAPIGSVVTIS